MKISSYIILGFSVLTSASVFAGRIGPPPPGAPTPPGLPIDGNIIVLLGVALIYGWYKVKKR